MSCNRPTPFPFPLKTIVAALLCALIFAVAGCATSPHARALSRVAPAPEHWIDLISGEEVDDSDVIDDLATAGVVYVGEAHTVARHHALQLSLFQALFNRRVPLVLCLEQLEASDQAAVDRYARKEIDFETLAREIDWAKKWRNFADYRALCEFARQHGVPIRALNAPADLIRAVSRSGGVAQLTPAQRAGLPADLVTSDPAYERLMNLQLAVHAAADPAKLRPMFEAQMARDETMATHILAARQTPGSATPRTAFVVVGAGHIRFALGTVASVRRRSPGIVDRLVLATGNAPLTAQEQAASREVNIAHADLRAVGPPPADYLRVLPDTTPSLPPGHPPLPAAVR